ncbi:MAG: hypothetical protein V4697_02675 [Patescibacteria group bacterium]
MSNMSKEELELLHARALREVEDGLKELTPRQRARYEEAWKAYKEHQASQGR